MNRLSVLIVEDNSVVAEDIKRCLEGMGYRVPAIAASYAEAIQESSTHMPDVVLMDIKLSGGKTGIQAAEVIARDLNLPIVFLTAHSDPGTLNEAKNANPFGYVVKPFQVGELHTAIEMALYRFKLENRLKKSEAWLSTTLRSIGDAIIATETDGKIAFMNSQAERLTGWSAAEGAGKPVEEVFKIVNGKTGLRLESPIFRALGSKSVVGLEKDAQLIRKDGRIVPVGDSAAPIRDDSGQILGAVLVFRDSSNDEISGMSFSGEEMESHIGEKTAELARADNEDLKKHILELQLAEEKIQHAAYHDALTGLPNRLLFSDRLEMALRNAQRKGDGVAVLYLDLDQFKIINDTMGHALGDRLIQMVGEKLESTLREGDTIARQGGDEFILIIQSIGSVQDVIQVAERIKSLFEEPWKLYETDYFITVSGGIALFPDDGATSALLLQNAENAMYRAKEAGRNLFQLFSPIMQKNAQERLLMDRKFRTALREDQFLVHYQPQFNVQSNSITGMEALIRWNDPEIGLVPPGKFIPLAEETGMILKIGECVLRKSLDTMRRWLDAGMKIERMAVNLSARQFQQKNFCESILEMLDEYSLPPWALELEITESILMYDIEKAAAKLLELEKIGISTAIDDFGTGYSSLNYLKVLPVRKLKIDRSFIMDLHVGRADEAIVRAIIAMAGGLEKEIIAEGVETEEQLDFLLREGCFNIQGFYYSKPLPEEEALKLLSREEN